MDIQKQYDFLIVKNAKFQVLLNLIINGFIVLLAMGKFESVPLFEVGGALQDLLTTNFFVIFFLYYFGKADMEKWRVKNGETGVWYKSEQHGVLNKYLKRGFFMNFLYLYVKHTLTFTLITVAFCHFAYQGMSGIPMEHFMFIKILYVCLLANSVAMIAGRVGSIDTDSIPQLK